MVTLFARVYQNVMRVFSYLLNFREPKLIKGDSSLIEIYGIILKEKKTKPLIFTDEVLLNLHIFDQLFEILDKKKVPYVVFSKIKPNPTIDVVEEAFSLYKSASCDMLIAFISEKDSGTAFEIGYAKALDKQVVLLCYNEDDFKSTTNIMLAFAADAIIPVSDLPKLLVEDIYTGEQIYINDDWKSNLQ